MILIGLVAIGLGIAMTMYSYENAGGSGRYFIVYGPIVVGVHYVFRGVYKILFR